LEKSERDRDDSYSKRRPDLSAIPGPETARSLLCFGNDAPDMCIVVRSLVFRRKPNFASKCPWALGGGHAYQNSPPNKLCAIHLERVYAQKEEIVAIEWQPQAAAMVDDRPTPVCTLDVPAAESTQKFSSAFGTLPRSGPSLEPDCRLSVPAYLRVPNNQQHR